ncbi:MAG: SH3 domain-containing protein [Hyphomonas sp.]
MKRAPLALAILLALVPASSAETGAEAELSRFSGKPVPRFETLRWAEVNGRVGPSLSYPIAWRYNRKGLPVLVVKESGEWRRVRDPAGDEVWVHDRMLASGPMAMVTETTMLFDAPARDAASLAEVGEGVLVEVERCDNALCRVRAGSFRGWIARAKLWGTAPPEGPQTATNG